ncbi:(2Fe-2S)-binding protein [Acetobacter papayae]|uniref:(2Fe-2S)-binding protein n=1 Tax=Acetobacter papayae TaxID=1076592 RepID=UPI000470C9C1|nr:(2Fe-2S)-binding protein [Acetobacter papayae]
MITLNINGIDYSFDGDPEMPLLWYLRDEAGLTGTKFGCGMALCGACTVHVDGAPARSCMLPVGAVRGRITTIEAVAETHVGRAVQEAWVKAQVPQCGYCQSGQVMTASALLAKDAKPTEADIDAAMSGNICRCATYNRIREAINDAAEVLTR